MIGRCIAPRATTVKPARVNIDVILVDTEAKAIHRMAPTSNPMSVRLALSAMSYRLSRRLTDRPRPVKLGKNSPPVVF
jgi:hypothetical protein